MLAIYVLIQAASFKSGSCYYDNLTIAEESKCLTQHKKQQEEMQQGSTKLFTGRTIVKKFFKQNNNTSHCQYTRGPTTAKRKPD
jgi:hypothetical protein